MWISSNYTQQHFRLLADTAWSEQRSILIVRSPGSAMRASNLNAD